MGIAARLASALGRNDERPNGELAEDLAASGNTEDVAELATLLVTGMKPARHDAIKALYELGERRPELIAPHADIFLDLLSTKDNRMLWGAMSALAALAPAAPEKLAENLDIILAAADCASVIARDKAMILLASLATDPRFEPVAAPRLLQRLGKSAVNQVPMYAELTAPVMHGKNLDKFRQTVMTWHDVLPMPAKKRRLERLLRMLDKRMANGE